MSAPTTGCLPGCSRHCDDHDGATYCTAQVAALAADPVFTADPPRPVTVEIDRTVHADGRVEHRVAIVADGDPILIDPADAPAPAAAIELAGRVAR